MAYKVNLGCYGERIVEDADEVLEFVRTYYPDGAIYSRAGADLSFCRPDPDTPPVEE